MGFGFQRVWGVGFRFQRVWGVDCGFQSFVFEVLALPDPTLGLRLRVLTFEFRVWGGGLDVLSTSDSGNISDLFSSRHLGGREAERERGGFKNKCGSLNCPLGTCKGTAGL